MLPFCVCFPLAFASLMRFLFMALDSYNVFTFLGNLLRSCTYPWFLDMLTPNNVLRSIVQMLVTLGHCTLVSSRNNKHANFENIFDLILRVQRPLCLVFGNTSIFSDLLKGCFCWNQISGTVDLSPKQPFKTFFCTQNLAFKTEFSPFFVLKTR